MSSSTHCYKLKETGSQVLPSTVYRGTWPNQLFMSQCSCFKQLSDQKLLEARVIEKVLIKCTCHCLHSVAAVKGT